MSSLIDIEIPPYRLQETCEKYINKAYYEFYKPLYDEAKLYNCKFVLEHIVDGNRSLYTVNIVYPMTPSCFSNITNLSRATMNGYWLTCSRHYAIYPSIAVDRDGEIFRTSTITKTAHKQWDKQRSLMSLIADAREATHTCQRCDSNSSELILSRKLIFGCSCCQQKFNTAIEAKKFKKKLVGIL